ncbi:MAG: hypothetical protein WDZ63_17555 [Burkholderiales bacterium]
MSDSTILYAGIFCFSLIIIAFALTAHEFSKIKETGNASKRKSRVAYSA